MAQTQRVVRVSHEAIVAAQRAPCGM